MPFGYVRRDEPTRASDKWLQAALQDRWMACIVIEEAVGNSQVASDQKRFP